MSASSKQAYHDHKTSFPNATDKLRWLIKKYPGIEYPALEKQMGKPFSKFSGRISDMKANGEVYVDDSGEYSKHYYEYNKVMQGLRKDRHEYEEKLKKIKRFVDTMTGDLTERGKAELRITYSNVRERLKMTKRKIQIQSSMN